MLIDVEGSEHHFVATGEVVKFEGFLRVYRESFEDNENESAETWSPKDCSLPDRGTGAAPPDHGTPFAAAALQRGFAGAQTRRTRHRASFDVRAYDFIHPARICASGENEGVFSSSGDFGHACKGIVTEQSSENYGSGGKLVPTDTVLWSTTSSWRSSPTTMATANTPDLRPSSEDRTRSGTFYGDLEPQVETVGTQRVNALSGT